MEQCGLDLLNLPGHLWVLFAQRSPQSTQHCIQLIHIAASFQPLVRLAHALAAEKACLAMIACACVDLDGPPPCLSMFIVQWSMIIGFRLERDPPVRAQRHLHISARGRCLFFIHAARKFRGFWRELSKKSCSTLSSASPCGTTRNWDREEREWNMLCLSPAPELLPWRPPC